MNNYTYKVCLCDGHYCDGNITVQANAEVEAYEKVMDYVLGKLANALPELGVDVSIELEEKHYYEAIEMCPHCGNESVYPMWDVNVKGYVAICNHCGKEIMLCDECIHAEDELNAHCMGCDWRKTECGGKCFRGETRGS